MVAACATAAATPRAPVDADVAPFSLARTTSSDIEEQAASLREWDQIYEQMTPGRFVGGLHELRFSGLQLFRETTNQAVHESGTPWPGSRAIGVPTRMDGSGLFGGEAVATDAIVTLGPDEELDFYTPRGFEILGLAVDAVALERHASEVEHRDVSASFANRRVLRPRAERLSEFQRLLQSVLQSSEVNPSALQYRQSQRVLEQTMLSGVVSLTADDAPSQPASCASRRYIVDAAKEVMLARVAEPLTVADLCRELHVSRRTLQYSFQEVLGINPVRFLRAIRLNGARRDLNAGKRPRDSVQEIAARWGFWHLGHFVTDYKRMFGELPSETLGRTSGPAIARRRFGPAGTR